METIRFKADTRLRTRVGMVPESGQHPAKGHLGLWQTIIERYTEPGDTILDPMAGVGSTLLAALMGRNVICVELESHFVEPMRASWEKMRQHPMLGCELGEVRIFQGDSRDLRWLWPVDCVVTSPPYQDEREGGGLATREYQQRSLADGTAAAGIPGRKNTRIDQWGYTRRPVDSIITSPPYEESYSRWGDTKNELMEAKGLEGKYTRPVDAVVTSPPYEGTLDETGREGPGATTIRTGRPNTSRGFYSEGRISGNIGNERGQQYWQSMTAVYRECHRILKPGGIMALVLKGFTRDGQYVDLPAMTQTLVESFGFQKFDHWRRELWSLSFWRILQGTDKEETVVAKTKGMFDLNIQEVKRMKRVSNGKLDDRLRFEEVLAFRKPEGEGQGIQAVITSPPYEGSLQGDEPRGKLFETERRVNSPASGNRRSLRKPLGQGYTRQISVVITSPPYEASATGSPGGGIEVLHPLAYSRCVHCGESQNIRREKSRIPNLAAWPFGKEVVKIA